MATYGDIRTRFEMAMNEARITKKSIEEFWLNGFQAYMKSKDYAKVSSRKGNTGEVLRASFGPNDGTSEAKIIEFLKEVGGLEKKSYEIENLGVGPVSSDFVAYKITFTGAAVDRLGKNYKRGDFFVITNRYKVGSDGEHSVIGRKDLTPDKLKITRGEYKSADALLAVIKPAINGWRYPEHYIQFILRSTQEVIDNPANRGKFTDFQQYSEAPIQNIEYSISPELFEGIDQLSINNFQNDYGEILGGFALFNLLKRVKNGISFPQASNEKLVDFYFDGYSVSSKAGTGGTPTGDTIIRKIHQLYQQGIIQPSATAELDFFQNVVLAWVNAPSHLSGSSIYNNIMNLAQTNIKDTKNSGYWYLQQQTGLSPAQLTQRAVEEYLDELYQRPAQFEQLLQQVWTRAGMKWNSSMLQDYIQQYPQLQKGRIGVVFYAIHVEVANTLNELYSEQLTRFAQMATDVKQLYLDVLVKQHSFRFRAVPFKKAKFVFSQKGSMPNPFNSNIGIKIKK